MNKKTFAYVAFLGAGVALSWIAIFVSGHRVILLMSGAFAFLALAWLIELSFSRKRRGWKTGQPQSVRCLGVIELDGQLTVSDQLSFSESQSLTELPCGSYSLEVETRSDADGRYVAAICLIGTSPWEASRQQVVRVAVDTSFLVFVGTEVSKELQRKMKEAQSKILSDTDRELDVEVLELGQRNVGLVTATGFGDGQYLVELSSDPDKKPHIRCRFIE